jgi:DNA processing protein
VQQERAYWLAWSQINGVGPILLKRIQQHFGTLAEAWQVPAVALGEVEGFGTKLIEAIKKERAQLDPVQLLEEHSRNNTQFWTPADSEYPRLLLEIPSPPPILYYRGKVQPQENQGITPLIAIVGTRYPTEYGKRWTRKITFTLVKHGFCVVSGMAAGIDTEAHRGCLEASGRTITVLGTGVDVVYPASNQQLYQQIQSEGLILSEYPAGTQPERGNFPARNRIIAGLCRAILIMEAPTKSGALITAHFANDFGRDVYVLPGSLDNQQSLGCLGLLNRGANIILSEEHLLEMLGTIPQLDKPEPSKLSVPLPELEPQLALVLQNIAAELTPFDLIVQKTNLDTSAISAALLQLELMGLVAQLPGMRYQRK